MIIFKKDNQIFCIFNNPKCGSSTISKFIYPQIKKKYKIIHHKKACISKTGYDNINYNHCNLKGAVKYLEKKKLMNKYAKSVVFIISVREPVKRVISSYYYELKLKKLNKWKYDDVNKDIEKFLSWNHIQQFYPNNYRFYKNHTMTDLIRLEHLQKDFKKVNDKYGLGLDISNLNKKKVKFNNNNPENNSNSPKLKLPESLINKIKEKYKLDYDEVYS